MFYRLRLERSAGKMAAFFVGSELEPVWPDVWSSLGKVHKFKTRKLDEKCTEFN